MVTKHIVRNRHIMSGKPCIRNSRILVEAIVQLCDAGYSFQDIWRQYPTLTYDQMYAALTYDQSLRQRIERAVSAGRVRLGAWLLGVSVEDVRESGL